MKRRTLVDLIRFDLERDPGDAPAVYLEADVMADDMARYAPEAEEPVRPSSSQVVPGRR